MQNYIKIDIFGIQKTNHDFTIQIQKENLPIFRLHDITNTLRLKQGEYVPGLVVNQYQIVAKTNEITDEIIQNYIFRRNFQFTKIINYLKNFQLN